MGSDYIRNIMYNSSF